MTSPVNSLVASIGGETGRLSAREFDVARTETEIRDRNKL